MFSPGPCPGPDGLSAGAAVDENAYRVHWKCECNLNLGPIRSGPDQYPETVLDLSSYQPMVQVGDCLGKIWV